MGRWLSHGPLYTLVWSNLNCKCDNAYHITSTADMMDQAKLAKLQAAAAANRIGERTRFLYLSPHRANRARWKGDRAQKDCPENEAVRCAGRQKAARRTEKIERPADSWSGGSQHVQRGRECVAFHCPERYVGSERL